VPATSGAEWPSGGTGDSSTGAGAPNYYQLLGVTYTASRAELTRAYREKMKVIHPDRKRPEYRAAAEELAKRLNVAYTTLSNPAKRTAYDQTIRADLVQDQLMSRYVGGFYPGGEPAADPFAQHLKREETAGERRERAEANRTALMTLISAFAVLLAIVIGLLLLWSGAAALLDVLR
jgi:DnaJ-class molecular chaperone